MTDIIEDNIDYDIMQFTPLPHAVGKIWLDSSDSEDDEDNGPIIESWANDKDDDAVIQQPTVDFEKIEEQEIQEEIENSYEYIQQHLYHPPTQAEFIKKYMSRNNNNNNEESTEDDFNFDDINEFAILAEKSDDEESKLEEKSNKIIFDKKQQPQIEIYKQNETKEQIEKQSKSENSIKIEKPTISNGYLHEVSVVKPEDTKKELKGLQICLNVNKN